MFEDAPASVAAGWVARTLAPDFVVLAWSYAREASYLNERAIWRVPRASKEARGTGTLNLHRFYKVILFRGCVLT